jgi:lipid II:glycine glycyltransferase (peptidoglycan interpeptide bridge formation enzyme)
MKFQRVSAQELSAYDKWLENADNGHLLQSSKWAEFKRGEWKPYCFFLKNGEDVVGAATVLVRSLPMVKKKVLYLSRGPVLVDYENRELWQGFTAGIAQFAREIQGAVIKIDPAIPQASSCAQILQDLGYKSLKTQEGFGGGIQPAATIRVDLTLPLEEIHKRFPKKTRYGIRHAESNGVVFQREGVGGIDEFYEAMQATARRAKLVLRPLKYYRSVLDLFGNDATLINSYLDNQLISSGLYVKFGNKVWALYGGITYKHSHIQVGHALEWEGMKWAKEKGAQWFDFFGIPVFRESESKRNKEIYGIYRFKRTFGGEELDFIGEYDLAVDSFAYGLWQVMNLGRKGILWLKKRFS